MEGNQNRKFYKNPLFLAATGILLVSALIVLVLVFINRNQDDNDGEPSVTDASEEYETLNNTLESLISSNPHKDYQSSSSTTHYINAPESYFYDASDYNYFTDTLLFTSTLSILSQTKITPKSSFSNTSFQDLATKNNLSYQQLNAANHNILNYYLDHDAVIIICATGSFLYSETEPTCLLVYAAAPADGIYYISSPTNPPYIMNGVTRTELLSNIKDSATFHIFSTAKIE
ncbi:hypothetical protein IJG96_02465 [Candidatus Saccharibacteria bacterium]|nr:hypothetical protein [Candidatus Saccharibacteria bacterium]